LLHPPTQLRTPLQAVTGAVALLAGALATQAPAEATAATSSASFVSSSSHELLELLEEGSAQLTRVLTDIIDYDALQRARPGIAACSLDVAAAPAASLAMMDLRTDVLLPALSLADLPPAAAARLARRAVALRCVVQAGVPVRMAGDVVALRRVVCSLVANALKYAPENAGGAVTLTVERCDDGMDMDDDASATAGLGHVHGPALRLRVSDNGCGITAARLAGIFSPLGAARDGARHEHGGAGLGLAICALLATRMGALLSARSDGIGLGATFMLTVPLAASEELCLPVGALKVPSGSPHRVRMSQPYAPSVALPAADDAAATLLAALSPRPAGSPPKWMRGDGSPLRVLLAEDNALCAAVVCRLLARTGASVTAVADGAQAVQRCCAPGADYDLVLLDLEMPVMDGVTAAREIASKARPSVPTVALSASCSAAVRESCRTAGMVAHMSKPLRMGDLPALRAHAKC
jgi:signal transduction histidine kinase